MRPLGNKLFNHAWRLFGTALGFAVFGIVGLLLGLLLFPLMFGFIPDRQARTMHARRTIGRAFGGFTRLIKCLGVTDYVIDGREHMKVGANHLIIANHPTLIDVVILISLFPQANCVIKEAVRRNPVMRSAVSAADYISNSEPEELLTQCVAYLRSGGSLILFPEGTRTAFGQAMEFKPGAATVAARSGIEILPIAIDCNPSFLRKEQPWHYVPPTKPIISIRILPPVSASELVPGHGSERQARHELNVALQDLISHELAALSAPKIAGASAQRT